MKKSALAFTIFISVAGGAVLLQDRFGGHSAPSPPSPRALKDDDVSRPMAHPSRPDLPDSSLSSDITVDRILIDKSARRMKLYCGGKCIRKYRVALGPEPVGKKTAEGDGRTPEGCYIIDRRNADSCFHRALHISYPNEEDKRRAAELGVSPGGDIMIHGLKNGTEWIGKAHRLRDWTLGCVAVTNKEIEEIWRLVPDGTRVEIVP